MINKIVQWAKAPYRKRDNREKGSAEQKFRQGQDSSQNKNHEENTSSKITKKPKLEEITEYIHFLNHHPTYESKRLHFQLVDNDKIELSGEDESFFQVLDAYQLQKIYQAVKFSKEHVPKGQVLNISC